jgi:hypothetical protein
MDASSRGGAVTRPYSRTANAVALSLGQLLTGFIGLILSCSGWIWNCQHDVVRVALRDRRLCNKPSRREAATQAAWNRRLSPLALLTRFQFALNPDTGKLVATA